MGAWNPVSHFPSSDLPFITPTTVQTTTDYLSPYPILPAHNTSDTTRPFQYLNGRTARTGHVQFQICHVLAPSEEELPDHASPHFFNLFYQRESRLVPAKRTSCQRTLCPSMSSRELAIAFFYQIDSTFIRTTLIDTVWQ
jgi:hypothetical protein